MPNIFFISDHHLQHRRALEKRAVDGGVLRPGFSSVEEMDEHIIAKHNSVVQPEDMVWFGGDVTWKNNTKAAGYLARMNGKKNLVLGNHDNGEFLAPYFERVRLWYKFEKFIFSHVPLRNEDMIRCEFNVHGHLHDRIVKRADGTPDRRYVNVCVEQLSYVPTSMEELGIWLR